MSYDHQFLLDLRRKLEQPEVPDHVLGEKDGSELMLSVISCSSSAEHLIIELEQQDLGSDWGFREWIEEAIFYPGFVVSARTGEDERAVGFLAFDTRVFIHTSGGTGASARISITLEPKTVYVAPEHRGRGFGDAFAGVLSRQVAATLGRLASMSRNELRGLNVDTVSVGIEAECVSEHGARFVRKAFAACEAELSRFGPIGSWPGAGRLDDNIDYGDYSAEALPR